MDTKRLISMMLLSFAVIFGWQLIMFKIYGDPRQRAATTAPATQSVASSAPVTTAPAMVAASAASATQPSPATQPQQTQPQLTQAPVQVVSPATQPAFAILGSTTDYSMTVRLTSVGAGVESVELREFDSPNRKTRYTFQTPADPTMPLTRPFATRSIFIDGNEVSLAGVNWTLEQADDAKASFSVDLGSVKLRKVYELQPGQLNGKTYERYDLNTRYEIQNVGSSPAKVKLSFNGAIAPPHENEQGHDVQALAGYDDGYGRVTVAHHYAEEFGTKHPSFDLTTGEEKIPLLWAGTASVYFNALLRPMPLDETSVTAKYIGEVVAEAVDPNAPPLHRVINTRFATTDLTVEAGKVLTLPASAYLGPRWRKILDQPVYSQFPPDFDQSVVLTSGPCAWCTFSWLIDALVRLLSLFHWMFRDWGLAIIALVILVRALLHPITKRSQISMLRMGKLGPEIERLKKKHGDDKDELNRQMMALYKDQGIGAYLGCLPMFLQMPIWIALWSALNTTFELRQSPFLWGWTWIDDLSRPDLLINFGRNIQLPLGLHLSGINLLPLLLAVVFYLQQEFTPKPPATTPEQETQQKMMKWMSLLFPIFLYNGPSGLNLYILTSTTIGIIESKRIRDHIKQKEEDEKAGKIIVDAPRGMKKKRDDDNTGGPMAKLKGPKPAPKTGLAGWMQQLKEKAEQLQREADKTRGK